MKTFSRLILLIVVSTSFYSTCYGQKASLAASITPQYQYKNAIGVRAGGTSGISFKHFLNAEHAFELILGIWPNAIGLTAMYEKHAPTNLEGLKFYYGVGAHVTGETGTYYYRTHRRSDRDYIYRYGIDGSAVGIDGIAGIEYKIGVVPLALSFDLKPYLEISNYGTIYTALDPALGIKLAF